MSSFESIHPHCPLPGHGTITMPCAPESRDTPDAQSQTLLHALLHRENRYYSRLTNGSLFGMPDSNARSSGEGWLPTSSARNKIGEWAIQIMDHYDFSRHCVSVALNFMDRMLHCAPCGSCLQFQLLSVGCVFLAMKLSGNSRVLSVTGMAHHVQGRFTAQQIIDMEYEILSRLDWVVHPPTAGDFLHHYWSVLVVHSSDYDASDYQDILDTATFLVEHTVIDSFFSSQKPSVIAMAALSLTIPVQVPAFLDFDRVQLCRHRLRELAAQNIAIAEEHQRTHSPISVSARACGDEAIFGQHGDQSMEDKPPTSF